MFSLIGAHACAGSGLHLVERLVYDGGRSSTPITFGDVVDIREVALHVAVVEEVYRPAFKNYAREDKERHIRSAPRAVDGEKWQSGGWNPEHVAVEVRHQLIRFLRYGMQTDGMIDAVRFENGTSWLPPYTPELPAYTRRCIGSCGTLRKQSESHFSARDSAVAAFGPLNFKGQV